MICQRRNLARVAAPAGGGAGPAGGDFLLFPVLHLDCQGAVAVDHEAGPIEHQFILSADAVDIGQRQIVIDRAALGHAVDPQGILVDLIRAAIDAEQQFGAEFGQMAAHVRMPDILADRQADHHPAKHHGFRKRARLEQPHFIEGAIVRQFVLEPDRRDLPLVQQGHAVVQVTVDHEDRADQHGRAAVCRGLGQRFKLSRCPLDQGRFQHQVFRRIADQLHFGENDQVRACRPRPFARGQHGGGIAGDIADGLVQLGKRDG